MTTLPSGFAPSLVPTFAIAVRLGVAAASPADAPLRCMLLASKTDGVALDNVVTEVFDDADANLQFGARSRLAAACRAFRKLAPGARLFACPVELPSGTPASATATVTVSGPATGAGVLRMRVGSVILRERAIASGDTANQVAALAQAMVAERSDLLATGALGSGGSANVQTLTAATAGAIGNQLRVAFEVTAPGITIALNGGSAAARGRAYFTGGTGAVDLTAALTAIGGDRYDRVFFDVDDDTNRTRVSTFLETQSGINVGYRCMGVVVTTDDTVSNVQGNAVEQNEGRATLLYQRRSHRSGAEIGAAYIASKTYGDGRLLGEAQYRAVKANGLSLYPAIEATDVDERLTGAQVRALMASGVTIVGHDPLHPGFAAIVRPITTRTQNAQGGVSYEVIDTSKVAVADLVADRCEAFASANYADKNLIPDPVTIEQAPSSPFITWPAAVREDMLSILRQMEAEFLLVNVSANANLVTAERLVVDGTTYVVVRVPIAVIPHLHSVVGEALQIG